MTSLSLPETAVHDEAVIDTYIKALRRTLAHLPMDERGLITEEIRSHLEARADEDQLAQAIADLGPATQLGQTYVDELTLDEAKNNPARSLTTLWIMASRKLTAMIGFIVTGYLYFSAALFGLSALSEIILPWRTGLWIRPDNRGWHWGVAHGWDYEHATEVLGWAFLPINAGAFLGIFVLAGFVGRFFIRRMIGRKKIPVF